MVKARKIVSNKQLDFLRVDEQSEVLILYVGNINAGFPSPADDYLELKIDLTRELVKHPEATFYARVRGKSMINAGLDDGDVLIIDRSLEPTDGKIAVCYIDGEFTIKRLKVEKDICWLMPENEDFSPIKVTEENDFIVWGIVSYIIKKL